MIDGWGISCEIALILMSLDFIDDQSTLVQVMAWCRQATSHYLSQWWPRSMLPYGVTRPQWVNLSQSAVMCACLLLKTTSHFPNDKVGHAFFLLVPFNFSWHWKQWLHITFRLSEDKTHNWPLWSWTRGKLCVSNSICTIHIPLSIWVELDSPSLNLSLGLWFFYA